MRSNVRWVAAVAAVGVPTGVVLATYAAWRDRLPERMATHWSGSPGGAPDGFSSSGASAGWIGGICLLALVLAGVVAAAVRLRHANQRAARAGIAALASTSGLLAGAWLAVSTANLDVQDPAQAHLGLQALWILALLWGLVPLALLRGLPTAHEPAAHPAEPMPLAPDQQIVWVEVLSAPLLDAVVAVALVVVVVLAVVATAWLWLAAVPLALTLAVFAQIRVSVDRRGLRIVSGFLGLPIKRIALDRIAGAAVEQIDPVRWGGWGYRVLPERSALVLRGGPGLVLDLRDGRRFAVTLDDPATPARLIAGLLVRA